VTLLQSAIALMLGHVLADFTMQSDRMVQNKRAPMVLLGHVAIVAAVSWAALGFAPRPFATCLDEALGWLRAAGHLSDQG
jgi:hypothetical protein